LYQFEAKRAWEDKDIVEKLLTQDPRVEYFGGRCIKTDLTDPENFDLSLFKEQCRPDLANAVVEDCVDAHVNCIWQSKIER